MELEDFINDLDKEEQQEVYSHYKSQSIEYRAEHDFEDYINDYVKCDAFDKWHPSDYIKCENCGEWVHEDNITWFYEERICESCINDGYGE